MAPGASGPIADTPAPERIEPGHRVAEVLDWFPETLPVFERYSFFLLRQPRLRRTLARQVTIERAATLRGVETAALIEALNVAIAERRHSHPVA